MPDTITLVSRIVIKGTMQAVWNELTKTDGLQGAMFNTQMHTNGLKPGGQIRMRSADGKFTSVVGEILEMDPPRKYSHTFRFTNLDDPPCVVTYDLREVDGGVEFTLTSSNVPAGSKTAKEMARGGDMIVKSMKAIIETGKPPFGTRMLYVLFKVMGPFSPKSMRSENWPLDARPAQLPNS